VAGFFADKSKRTIMLGHSGSQYHYISQMFWHPKGNFGIIYTKNTEAYSNTSAQMFENMLNYYYRELLEVTSKVIKK
jgi:hypothetical protein